VITTKQCRLVLVQPSVRSDCSAARVSYGSCWSIQSDEVVQVLTGDIPLEGAGDLAVMLAEGQDRFGGRVERCEAVRGERLALEDREVQLDLVQPEGVHGQVDQPYGRPLLGHPVGSGLAGL
jgi:hypothetical protein